MRRRDLFALGSLAVAGAVAPSASAAGPDAKSGPAEVVPVNLAGVGLPIIVDGRVRNYVFIAVSLTPGAGHTADQLKAKEPYFRDALVRAAHRTPFVLADDWTQVDAAAVSAAMLRIAPAISGAGSVTAATVAMQTPHRRRGMRRG